MTEVPFEILEDGTIKFTVLGEIEESQHAAADEFFKSVAAQLGGDYIVEQRKPEHGHHHHHGKGHVHH